MLTVVGLTASLHIEELGELYQSSLPELSEVEDLRESLWRGNVTQANSTPVSKRSFDKRYDGILGQREGMFVEVTASLNSMTINKDHSLNATAETPDDHRQIFTLNTIDELQKALFPRFVGATEYFTGANYPMSRPASERQYDGPPYPGDGVVGTVPARLSSIFSMSSVSFLDGNATRSEIYAADNILSVDSNGKTTMESGKLRVIDVQTGEVSTPSGAVPDGVIYSVSAQSIMVSVNDSIAKTTMVYSAVKEMGFHRWDKASGLVELVVPGFNQLLNISNATEVAAWQAQVPDLKDSCLTTDHAYAYLHWNGKIFDLETAKCTSRETCVFRQLSEYKHLIAAERMHCAVQSQNQTLMFYASQGLSIVSANLAVAREPSSTEAPQAVVVSANGGTVDGGAPEFKDFTGIAVYSPPWLPDDEPFIMVTSDAQLRAIHTKTGFTSSIGPVARGPVAVVGEHAYTGEKVIYKSSLTYNVPCKDVNEKLARAVIEWQKPSSANVNILTEKVNVQLHDSGVLTAWEFVAMKKMATLNTGFMEKAMVCIERPLSPLLKRTYAQCCMTKFSKQKEGITWGSQLIDTQMY